ncbi:sugar ABC transporter permease [Ruthenibacterium sp. TH_2024_36131]|uniref:carbohydrate ABC transporter permease n=1 Tax=Owariibacterium komagatae TaxID=3136601 RepID=UPI0038B2E5B5
MKKTASLNYSTGKKWRLTGEDMWGYAFIAVAMIVFCVFTVYPVISAFFTSFEKYKPLGSTFVGLENYKTTFSSSLFYKSIWNTLVYTVFTVPLSLCISFIVAILILPFKKKVQSLFKSMYYLPAVASGVALSVVWLWIYDPLPTGLLNSLLANFGISNVNWLGSSDTAMFSLILMALLAGHGTQIIIYLAALLGVPSSLFEAADLDGATFLQKVWFIVLPLVKPTTLFLLVTGVIGSFQVFMNAYMMTGGGPDNATTMVGLMIFNNAFKYSDYGLACAQALILAVVIAAISLLQFKLMGEDVEY